VVVPGVDRREHHVARTEGDVLAADAGKIAFAGQAEANGIGRVSVRRHYLVCVIEPVRGVHRAHRRAPWRQTGVDQNERTAFRVVHRDQFGGPKQDRLDIVFVAPAML